MVNVWLEIFHLDRKISAEKLINRFVGFIKIIIYPIVFAGIWIICFYLDGTRRWICYLDQVVDHVMWHRWMTEMVFRRVLILEVRSPVGLGVIVYQCQEQV